MQGKSMNDEGLAGPDSNCDPTTARKCLSSSFVVDRRDVFVPPSIGRPIPEALGERRPH